MSPQAIAALIVCVAAVLAVAAIVWLLVRWERRWPTDEIQDVDGYLVASARSVTPESALIADMPQRVEM